MIGSDVRIRVYRHFRRGIVIVTHAFFMVAALLLAFFIRFDFTIPAQYLPAFYSRLVTFVAVQMVVFDIFHLYAGMWRYVSIVDIWNIVKANVIAMLVCAVLDWSLFGWEGFPRSVYLLNAIIGIGLMGGARVVARQFRERCLISEKGGSVPDNRILLVGAGSAGVMLFGEYRRNPGAGRVAGFIDDDPLKFRKVIHGIRVVGRREDIPRAVEDLGITEIVLSIPSASGEVMRDILSYCEQTRARIKVVPGLEGILSGQLQVKPRDVRPEDLLGRETVKINSGEVQDYLHGKTVLVTGAGGSIGSEICRQAASFGPRELILFDHHENDLYFLSLELRQRYPELSVRHIIGSVRDVGLLRHTFTRCRPQVVFHAAAHKHVPLMEDCPMAAIKNNIFGTRNLIYASHHYGVDRFVMISTDKAVNPINTMGMSKRVAEMILQARASRSRTTRFMAVRFGNVLGSAGSVVPLFKQQIEEGGPLTITHPDVKRYFMSIHEAVMLVLQAGALGKGGELFILDMGEQIRILDLARNLAGLSGLTIGRDIDLKVTGLRPGEKLEEELLLDKEKDGVTRHDRIFFSHCGETFDRAILRRNLLRLHCEATAMNEEAALRLLREIIETGNA